MKGALESDADEEITTKVEISLTTWPKSAVDVDLEHVQLMQADGDIKVK